MPPPSGTFIGEDTQSSGPPNANKGNRDVRLIVTKTYLFQFLGIRIGPRYKYQLQWDDPASGWTTFDKGFLQGPAKGVAFTFNGTNGSLLYDASMKRWNWTSNIGGCNGTAENGAGYF